MIRKEHIYIPLISFLTFKIQGFHVETKVSTSSIFTSHRTLLNLPTKSTLYSSTKSNPITRPDNEFSRSINVQAVLGAVRRNSRDYLFDIEATTEELDALSKRFKLSKISKLKADLTLKRSSSQTNSNQQDDTVHVEGHIMSTLTQTCVRTNEDFEVDLNFDLFAVVKSLSEDGRRAEDDLLSLGGMEISKSNNYKSKNSKNKKKNKSLSPKSRNMDDLGMLELQNLMNDFDYEDGYDSDVVEDYAVYQNGVLDAGELVSQMFRLKLDPYPKKPGSEPVSFSITG